MADKFPCPCCGYQVFDEPPGSFDICPICFWEDDVVQLGFPDLRGGANKLCLCESQENFRRIGVCEPRLQAHVRQPSTADVRDPGWRPLDPENDRHLSWAVPQDHKRWDALKNVWPLVFLYYWRQDYWLAAPQIEATVLRAINSFSNNLPPEQLEDMRSLVVHGEAGIALENLCTQLFEYDFTVHPESLSLLVTAGAAMGIKPEYWESLRPK